MNTSGRTVAPDPSGGGAARRDRRVPRRSGAHWERPRSGRRPPGRARARRSGIPSSPGRSSRRSARPPRARSARRRISSAIPLLSLPLLPLAAPGPAVLRARPPPARARDGTPPHVKPDEERVHRARRARGPRRPEPVHGDRSRQAGAVPAPDARRRPLLPRLRDAPLLQPRQPLRREDDPLRALGLHRRQAADVLREQLRRQPRELHGRLHRQGRLGAQPRLQQRRRLPADELARATAARGTSWRSRTTCACTRCRRASGTRPTAA